MEIIASSRNIRMSPRKVRRMATAVKKLKPEVALAQLSLLSEKASGIISDTLKSAIANATTNAGAKLETLKIKNILVDEGMKMKRQDRSHGFRYHRGLKIKRTSHITVILEN